jgi:putative FmdB family regulatory protein
MPFKDRVKETLADEPDKDGEGQYSYHCAECDSEFESPVATKRLVDCPACGASGTTSILSL